MHGQVDGSPEFLRPSYEVLYVPDATPSDTTHPAESYLHLYATLSGTNNTMPMASAYDFVSSLSPAQICQLFYVLSAAAVLAVAAMPDRAQQLLTQYGARSSTATIPPASSLGHKDAGQDLQGTNAGYIFHFVSCLTSAGKVPHAWFIHFYILSLSCTVFWAIQFITHGTLLELIVENQCSKRTSSMTLSQVVLVWFLMGLQGARRLYEYLAVLRPSSSRMWIIHWLLGNAFYLCTSVSIWVEGSSKLPWLLRGLSRFVLTEI